MDSKLIDYLRLSTYVGKEGYRNENFRGSGVRDLKKILEYEIIELENIDILEYVYFTMIQNDNHVYDDETTEFMNNLPTTLYILKSQPGYASEAQFNMDIHDIVDNLYKYLCCKDNIDKDLKYGLWLCDSPTDCYDNYVINKNGTFTIDTYSLDNAIYKISDLGKEGSLYCFITEPKSNYSNIVI